tara:strand:+ start:1830 stop:2003 length:174 start_codon:yes stop_codon:yes gene_type:complete
MKVYTLTIVYDDKKEEIEYISEEIEGDTEGVLELSLKEVLDEDDTELVEGCNIIGKA